MPQGAQRQPNRPHHIPAWAELFDMAQKDIVNAIGVDKAQVSRWFKGATPSPEWQQPLATLFETTPEGLFRHPAEVWTMEFFAGRDAEEIDRIKGTLERAFPRKKS